MAINKKTWKRATFKTVSNNGLTTTLSVQVDCDPTDLEKFDSILTNAMLEVSISVDPSDSGDDAKQGKMFATEIVTLENVPCECKGFGRRNPESIGFSLQFKFDKSAGNRTIREQLSDCSHSTGTLTVKRTGTADEDDEDEDTEGQQMLGDDAGEPMKVSRRRG